MSARWRTVRWLLLLLLAMGLAGVAAVPTDEPTPQPASDLTSLRYLTEEYKPYNYQEQHDPPTGLSVELLHRIWQRLGIAAQSIRVLPWARGYNLLSNQPDVVLFSTAQTRIRLPLFQWACPIARSPIVLIAWKESNIRLQHVQQLDRYRITAIRNDVGEQLLLSRGVDPDAIHNSNALQQALKQLPLHRTDLVSSNGPVAWQLFRDMGADLSRYEEVWTLGSEQFCYAFSRQVDPQLVRQFQQALDEVRQQADYPVLLQKFGLTP